MPKENNKVFRSTVLLHPGLNNSGPGHWQTLWEESFPNFRRIRQKEWDQPVCSEWIAKIDEEIVQAGGENVIYVGHSLACTAFVIWAKTFKRKIKGALLVAPSDTEAKSYPSGTTGFTPMPDFRLPFPSIVVTSDDDFYVSVQRAKTFASRWGSDLVILHRAGHINVSSGFGPWKEGLELLSKLDD